MLLYEIVPYLSSYLSATRSVEGFGGLHQDGDDERCVVPPLEDRVREAEWALVQVSEYNYRALPHVGEGQGGPHGDDEKELLPVEKEEEDDYDIRYIPIGVAGMKPCFSQARIT